MKKITLTQGFEAIVDDEDFDRVSAHKWCADIREPCVYARASIRGRQEYLHHFILKSNNRVDHKNRNGLDCQKHNLRSATQEQNMFNRTAPRERRVSNYRGVSPSPPSCRTSPWRASLTYRGKHHHLGLFSSEVEAALAYDEAAKKFFGEFAVTNM